MSISFVAIMILLTLLIICVNFNCIIGGMLSLIALVFATQWFFMMRHAFD